MQHDEARPGAPDGWRRSGCSRTALGGADQQHPPAARRIHNRHNVLGRRLHRRRGAHTIGKPDAAPVEQDEPSKLGEAHQRGAGTRLLPDALDMRHEARHELSSRPSPMT
jgi:hypothetical protein